MTLSVLTRNQAVDLLHRGSKMNWEETSVATIHVARKTVVPPNTLMCVPANSSVTTLFQLESTLLGPNFTILHVAAAIMELTNVHTFWKLIPNLSSRHRRLPKHVVLEHGTAPLLFIVRIENLKDASGV